MEDEPHTPEESLDSIMWRLNDAKLRLDFASQYVEDVESDYLSSITPSADPDTIERAIRAMGSAREEYLHMFEIYQDFVTRWKADHNGAGPQAGSGSDQPDPTRDREEP